MYCGGLRFDRLITSAGVALAAGGDPKVFVRTMIDFLSAFAASLGSFSQGNGSRLKLSVRCWGSRSGSSAWSYLSFAASEAILANGDSR